jgi:tRNA-specific 2-thiouridylase
MNMNKDKLVILGISGGVDSSVAALLLQQQGYNVEAVFMQNWQEDTEGENSVSGGGCNAAQDLKDAQQVCEKLSIPLHVVNFSHEYWYKVFQYFLDEYAAGRTPNPDVMCNKEIKFRVFLDYAKQLGADYIATGHYARHNVHHDSHQLLKAKDAGKDQTYFLYTLNQEQLKHVLFPLGDLVKDEVRTIAEKNQFINHAKKDSTGICFIGERKFKQFLGEYLLVKPGEIIEVDSGTVIGKHDGVMFYTLGQRQGLGIGGMKGAKESPWYVAGKDIKHNQLLVSQDPDHPMLLTDNLRCNQVHWISGRAPQLPLTCKAKIRYRQEDQDCVIETTNAANIGDSGNDNGVSCDVKFAKPQWAITPGQAVVFYREDECLGGGVIE